MLTTVAATLWAESLLVKINYADNRACQGGRFPIRASQESIFLLVGDLV